MEQFEYTRDEITARMQTLQEVFDIVRLVDPYHTFICRVDEQGGLVHEPFHCHAVWERQERCTNCVSLQVMAEHRRLSKYEFVGDEIYYVVSKYIIVEGTPCALELVTDVTNEIVLDAKGKSALVRAISRHNDRLYRDALTGAYNRNYYEEQLRFLSGETGVAMIDADDFKRVNDTYGHDAGDTVLHEVAALILKNIREVDALVRYGGDEFLLLLTDIREETFRKRLAGLPERVAALRFPDYPALRVSISVGAAWFHGKAKTEEAMKKTDEALYVAKKEKNCVRFA